MASLEARSGAPLPLGDVIYQIRRLDPWSLNRAVRYAAFYVRAEEASEDLVNAVDVNGRLVRVRFLSRAQRNRRARRLGFLAAVSSLAALAVSGSLTSALAVRRETTAQLDAVEKIASAKYRAAKAYDRERLLFQSLEKAGVSHQQLSDVLADLDWASRSKAPDARIEALHWDHGHFAVEVRGDGPPFLPGRAMTKDAKPLRARTWLWGVASRSGPDVAR